MGVFLTSKKPREQMEMGKETLQGNWQNSGIISLEQMTTAQFPLATESWFGLREVNGFVLFSCSQYQPLCYVQTEKLRQRNKIDQGEADWKQRMEEVMGWPEGENTSEL